MLFTRNSIFVAFTLRPLDRTGHQMPRPQMWTLRRNKVTIMAVAKGTSEASHQLFDAEAQNGPSGEKAGGVSRSDPAPRLRWFALADSGSACRYGVRSIYMSAAAISAAAKCGRSRQHTADEVRQRENAAKRAERQEAKSIIVVSSTNTRRAGRELT